MTMFADCRQKFTKDAYPFGTRFRKSKDISADEINPYWEGNLNEENKSRIRCFDWGAAEADNFFSNLCNGDTVIDYLAKDEAEKAEEICGTISAALRDDEDFDFDELVKDCPRIVKVIAAIQVDLARWVEMERNQIITSMIDSQEAEHETEIHEAD